MKKYQILFLVMFLTIRFSYGQKPIKYYLDKNSDVAGDGSIEKPFNNLKQVMRAIDTRKNSDIQVIIRKGTYELSEPLIFNQTSARDTLHSIEFMCFPGDHVTISGGKALNGKWILAEGNLWKLKVKDFKKERDIFRSLFANDKRLQRATSDTLFSKGPIPQYASLYKALDFRALKRLTKDSLNVFCGFVYADNSLDNIKDISGVEVIAYNSWEASWHTVRDIDKKTQIIYFKNPATYPVGFYNTRIRYRVENSKYYLDKPGEWILDYNSGEVWYYAKKGEDPNNTKFVRPFLDTLVILKGTSQNPVNNVKFSGLGFAYTSSAWGVNKISEQDKLTNSKKFPWIDFGEGFSSVQASLDCGAAILLESAKNCSFENCSFTHLGNYAIWIGKFSDNNTISKAAIKDIGGGGIIIGIDTPGGKHKNWPDRISPSYNKVLNCTISNCSVIFPSGVGIGIMQANNTLIKDNILHDLPYTGISVGWTYNFDDNYTSNNVIEGNYIFDVMKILADGGGIYTLGKQTGSVYKNNYIKNIYRSKSAIGSRNNGFFFDESSSDFLVDSNVVEKIQNQDIRYNKTDSTRIKFGSNYFEKTTANKNLLRLKQVAPLK